MSGKKCFINKHASIIYRMSQTYFDTNLAPYEIGGGQQYFLLTISNNPGITQYDLAKTGKFDKGTAARAVKKLEELQYIRRETGKNDRRTNCLYLTPAGLSIIKEIERIFKNWNDILTGGMTNDEKELAEKLMKRMAEQAFQHTKDLKEDKNGTISKDNTKKSFRISSDS